MRRVEVPAGPLPAAPLPNPAHATVVAQPPGNGPGYWAGAPSAVLVDGATYLAYRLRRPRNAGRGGQLLIARSNDGESFETIAALTKEDLDTESIERAALAHLPNGSWRLYVSYVDPIDGRWRIDALEAPRPDAFDPARRTKIITADDIGGEAVKDPVVLRTGGMWHLWASYLPRPDSPLPDLHTTKDAYTVGALPSHTGYATSEDGLTWRWHGPALQAPTRGWSAYCARITSVLLDGPTPLVYFDGGATVSENYEERTGVAIGDGPARFTPAGSAPAAQSPYGNGSLRYLCVLPVKDGYRMYYECAMRDGSHAMLTELAPLPS